LQVHLPAVPVAPVRQFRQPNGQALCRLSIWVQRREGENEASACCGKNRVPVSNATALFEEELNALRTAGRFREPREVVLVIRADRQIPCVVLIELLRQAHEQGLEQARLVAEIERAGGEAAPWFDAPIGEFALELQRPAGMPEVNSESFESLDIVPDGADLQSTRIPGRNATHAPAKDIVPASREPEGELLPSLPVGLIADANGDLEIARPVGGDVVRSFDQLREWALGVLGEDGPQVYVEFNADHNLRYENLIRAMSACSGHIAPAATSGSHRVRFLLAPPRAAGNQ
jgi:biopolymer transport protein ExbD